MPKCPLFRGVKENLKLGVAFYMEMEYTIKHVRENKVFTLL